MTKVNAGDVFTYPFLWKRQETLGETEGRKPRPVCIAVTTVNSEGNTLLFITPVTTLAPSEGRIALEVPMIEAKRVGLDVGKQCWVILDEYNSDVFERSYVFEDRKRLGTFSPKFTAELQRILLRALQSGTVSAVNRHD